MGWEVGKPKINTDFPLPTLQNSEKKVINLRLSLRSATEYGCTFGVQVLSQS